MENKIFNIIIADSQFLVRNSLETIISTIPEYRMVGIANNYNQLIYTLQTTAIDLLITDCLLFDFENLNALKQLKTNFPKVQILILTNTLSRNEIQELTKQGIKNIIYKTTDKLDLLLAIDASLKGKKFYADEVFDILTQSVDTPAKKEPTEPLNLTPSEIEIVKLIAEGFTTKEIAEKKHISFHTVMSHRKNIFRKLSVNNASELVIYAVRAGIVDAIEYYI